MFSTRQIYDGTIITPENVIYSLTTTTAGKVPDKSSTGSVATVVFTSVAGAVGKWGFDYYQSNPAG